MRNNTLQSIQEWFATAKPKPTKKDICTQIGCHFEEVAEMLQALGVDDTAMHTLAEKYKAKRSLGFSEADKLALLDALCDQIITAIGVGYTLGFDMQGAISEVNRSNWSKFVNGEPHFDANGKIVKGREYTPPKLEQYLNAY